MKPLPTPDLIAVDIGNTRVHLGRFDGGEPGDYPRPQERLFLPHQGEVPFPVDGFFPPEPAVWLVAGVHNEGLRRCQCWQEQNRPRDRFKRLDFRDVPLPLEVDYPERVGMDRLMGAVAAERLRRPGRAAVIIDMGTAVTVDALAPDGRFLGGAILPGIQMAAAALHRDTDALPLVRFDPNEPPEPIGRSTEPAIRSGLFGERSGRSPSWSNDSRGAGAIRPTSSPPAEAWNRSRRCCRFRSASIPT